MAGKNLNFFFKKREKTIETGFEVLVFLMKPCR